jgi:hypothetical protein
MDDSPKGRLMGDLILHMFAQISSRDAIAHNLRARTSPTPFCVTAVFLVVFNLRKLVATK